MSLQKMSYVIPNMSDEQLADLILTKVKNKESLGFTRFGDGEIMILQNTISNAVKDRMLKWNHGNFNSTVEVCQQIINTALSNSDILGFMNPNNQIAKKIKYDQQKWSIKWSYLESLRSDKPPIVDHMATRGTILGDLKKLGKIFGKTKICIISPRVKELKANKIEDRLKMSINYVQTPMNINAFDRSDIFKKLDTIQEHVILFGCAVKGKDFGPYLSKQGRIAIDYGATLDAWAGLITRPWFAPNNIQNHCLIK